MNGYYIRIYLFVCFVLLGVLKVQSQKSIVIDHNFDLKKEIENLPDNTTLHLKAGTYNIKEEILISEKKNISISGEGIKSTHIVIDSTVYIGFCILNNIDGLVIENVHIEGKIYNQRLTIPTQGPVATHAIGSHWGKNINIKNIVIKNNYIKNVAVGISIGSSNNLKCEGNTYDKVLIENNIIENVYGENGGSGYGIHNECASNVTIKDNRIFQATRHSIYQARGRGPVLIVGNYIINHGYLRKEDRTFYRTALCIARSSNITAIKNNIIKSKDVSISVEQDNLQEPCEDIHIVENKISSPFFEKILNKFKPDIIINNKKSVALSKNANQFLFPIIISTNGRITGEQMFIKRKTIIFSALLIIFSALYFISRIVFRLLKNYILSQKN